METSPISQATFRPKDAPTALSQRQMWQTQGFPHKSVLGQQSQGLSTKEFGVLKPPVGILRPKREPEDVQKFLAGKQTHSGKWPVVRNPATISGEEEASLDQSVSKLQGVTEQSLLNATGGLNKSNLTLRKRTSRGVPNLSRRKTETTELSPHKQGFYYKEKELYADLKSFSSAPKGRYNSTLFDNKALVLESLRKKDLIDSYNALMQRVSKASTHKGKNYGFEPDPEAAFGSSEVYLRHQKELNQSNKIFTTGHALNDSYLKESSETQRRTHEILGLHSEINDYLPQKLAMKTGTAAVQVRDQGYDPSGPSPARALSPDEAMSGHLQSVQHLQRQVFSKQTRKEKHCAFTPADSLSVFQEKKQPIKEILSIGQPVVPILHLGNNHSAVNNSKPPTGTGRDFFKLEVDKSITETRRSNEQTFEVDSSDEDDAQKRFGVGYRAQVGEKVTKETLMQKRESRKQKRNRTTVEPRLTTGMLQYIHEKNGMVLPQPEHFPEAPIQENSQELSLEFSQNDISQNERIKREALRKLNERAFGREIGKRQGVLRAHMTGPEKVLGTKKGEKPSIRLPSKNNLNEKDLKCLLDNQSQRQLYGRLKGNSMITSEQRLQAFQTLEMKGQVGHTPKIFSPNSNSRTIETKCDPDNRRFETAISTAGHQQHHFDIINQKERRKELTESKSKMQLGKINGISEFAHRTQLCSPNPNIEFRVHYAKNPDVFKRVKSNMTTFMNLGTKHQSIVPAGKHY